MAKYSDIRDKIKSGDVLFWSNTSITCFSDLIDRFIMFATNSKYYHVGVAWVVGGRVLVIESVITGVRIYPLSNELPVDIAFMPDYWNNAIEEFVLSHVGDKYSVVDAVKAFFNILKNGKDLKWECAELVGQILSMANIIDSYRAIPEDLYQQLLERHVTFESIQ